MGGGRLPVRPELGTEKPSVPTYLTGDFLMARSGLYPIKIISKDPGGTEAGIKQPWLWFQFQVPRIACSGPGRIQGRPLTLSTNGPLPAFFADTGEGVAVDHTGASIVAGAW